MACDYEVTGTCAAKDDMGRHIDHRCETHDAVLVWCNECIKAERASHASQRAELVTARRIIETLEEERVKLEHGRGVMDAALRRLQEAWERVQADCLSEYDIDLGTLYAWDDMEAALAAAQAAGPGFKFTDRDGYTGWDEPDLPAAPPASPGAVIENEHLRARLATVEGERVKLEHGITRMVEELNKADARLAALTGAVRAAEKAAAENGCGEVVTKAIDAVLDAVKGAV